VLIVVVIGIRLVLVNIRKIIKMKKKAKKRGRPHGARNKYQPGVIASYLTEILLKCKNCKQYHMITTQKKNVDIIYTKKVRKNWHCGLC
jgi:hypothetical protein